MRAKICLLAVTAAFIGLLLTGFAYGLLESRVTVSVSGVIQPIPTPTPSPTPSPTETYTYIINVSGANYQTTDGTTGQIYYQSTSATQVINNAIGNLTQGQSILFRSGTYNLHGSITSKNKNNITLVFENNAKLFVGNGMNNAAIFLDNSYNCLIFGVTIDGNAANQGISTEQTDFEGITIFGSNNKVENATIYNCRMHGVRIGSSATTINSGVINSKIYNCGWNGFSADMGIEEDSYCINTEIYGCGDVGATTGGINTRIEGNYIHDMNGTTGDTGSHWGIGIEGGYGAVITDNIIENCYAAIWNNGFNNCTIISNTITNGSGTAALYDGAQYGITLVDGSYNTVTNNYISGITWSGTSWGGGIGIWLVGATYNTISENDISNCGSGGIFLDATSNYNTVNLNNVSDTQSGRYWDAPTGYSGIELAGDSNYISQNHCFDDRSGVARTQRYGITLDIGATNNVLIGNNVHNNLDNQIIDPNVPENTMIDNTGYNPVGYIISPISGNTAYLVDSGSNSVWISGRVYTNTGSPKALNISAGTVSSVTQNGVILFTKTECIVTLWPGDTFSITFSSAPIIKVTGL